VNLNDTRLHRLDNSGAAIYSALQADEEIGSLVIAMISQGSRAHRLIIKPLPGKEFDGDFLVEMAENDEWADSPKTYIDKLYAALHRHATYGDMPHSRKCRCVRVGYKGDFHVDLVPFVRLSDGRQVIVNRDEDTWEDTNPEGFTEWIKNKDGITGGNLRRVIRILKYLRDHKGTFSGTRSVILTTIVGERVEEWKKAGDPNYYCDVPTTLLHVVQDLDAWLQAHPYRPSIYDPSGSGTTFDHRWDDAAYLNLRDRIHTYASDIKAAYEEENKDTSIEMWQAIFGEGFKAPPPKSSSGRFGAVTPVPTRPARGG
jgi:hypothetical protein